MTNSFRPEPSADEPGHRTPFWVWRLDAVILSPPLGRVVAHWRDVAEDEPQGVRRHRCFEIGEAIRGLLQSLVVAAHCPDVGLGTWRRLPTTQRSPHSHT